MDPSYFRVPHVSTKVHNVGSRPQNNVYVTEKIDEANKLSVKLRHYNRVLHVFNSKFSKIVILLYFNKL